MEIEFKMLNKLSFVPRRTYDSDAGFDLLMPHNVVITGMIRHFKSGIAVSIPQGYVGLILPRSSASETDIRVCTGVIDAGYRGEIMIGAYTDLLSKRNVDRGAAFAQLVILPLHPIVLTEVQDFSPTHLKRGTNGFGSTGR